MQKQPKNSYDYRKASNKKPRQIWWTVALRDRFRAVVQDIDPLMSDTMAILKLIQYSIENRWIPGYSKSTPTVISNTQDMRGRELDKKIGVDKAGNY